MLISVILIFSLVISILIQLTGLGIAYKMYLLAIGEVKEEASMSKSELELDISERIVELTALKKMSKRVKHKEEEIFDIIDPDESGVS